MNLAIFSTLLAFLDRGREKKDYYISRIWQGEFFSSIGCILLVHRRYEIALQDELVNFSPFRMVYGCSISQVARGQVPPSRVSQAGRIFPVWIEKTSGQFHTQTFRTVRKPSWDRYISSCSPEGSARWGRIRKTRAIFEYPRHGIIP